MQQTHAGMIIDHPWELPNWMLEHALAWVQQKTLKANGEMVNNKKETLETSRHYNWAWNIQVNRKWNSA